MSFQRYEQRRRHVRASEPDAAQVPVRGLDQTPCRNATHRTTRRTTRDRELNALIPFKAIDTTGRKKVRGFLRATQDLEQHRNRGGIEGNAIDSKLKERSVLISCKTACKKWRVRLTSSTSKLMLMSAPPGTGFPGLIFHAVRGRAHTVRGILTTGVGTSGCKRQLATLCIRKMKTQLTCRLVSTSGSVLTGMSTVGSTVGYISGAQL
jgi:hypothetical protein